MFGFCVGGRDPAAPWRIHAGIKKARIGEPMTGFCSLPHVGRETIVKETLFAMHAAAQHGPDRFRKTNARIHTGA
jgi:hypothetical protein